MAIPWWWTAIAAPLLTAAVTLLVGYVAIRFDLRKSLNQELIRKRIAVYEQVAPRLNDLYCMFLSLGAWKTLKPPAMIGHKRDLDRLIYIYGPLFSQATFDRYKAFINCCFRTFNAVGTDARLRANRRRIEQEWGKAWQDKWAKCFVDDDDFVDEDALMMAYAELMNQLAAEIGAPRRKAAKRPAAFAAQARPDSPDAGPPN